MNQSDQVMNERNDKYGNAWFLTGKVTHECFNIARPVIFTESALSYNWQIIVCKMMRCIWSPLYDDNWLDTLNYSRLIVERVKFDFEINYQLDLKSKDMFNKCRFVIRLHTDHPRQLEAIDDAGILLQWCDVLTECMTLFRFPYMKSSWQKIANVSEEVLNVISRS